ncbi:hypothetical protein RHGRI_002204 [Rhododendron griersonianum]|uniref:Uncharacterized protein n=1 Tax=Rhododendron griersonianum TaxID=479676 RepID=A0AAV6LNQ7_9ERIC|nr:hypothetical protein RHGRI_002204 [Rhododendron griersonianum]
MQKAGETSSSCCDRNPSPTIHPFAASVSRPRLSTSSRLKFYYLDELVYDDLLFYSGYNLIYRCRVIVLEMELHYQKFEFATRDEMSSPGRYPVDNGTRGRISRAFAHTYNVEAQAALPRTGWDVDLHFNCASGQLMSKNGP